jgi:hypothetical protein
MHFLYAAHVTEDHLNPAQRTILRSLQSPTMSVDTAPVSHNPRRKDFGSAQDWVTAFFDKGAEEVLGYYADDFVWEDIEFMQTITTKEELYKAFVVFNNSGPESPFGVHKFEVLSYDGDRCKPQRAKVRPGGTPSDFGDEIYRRYADNIFLGADFEYDEWGYMQWIWKATHNEDFFGIPAAGKTTYTRGTTTQFYRNGKIVRCRTHWNFREFAMQLGLIPFPDEAWRNNPGLNEGR